MRQYTLSRPACHARCILQRDATAWEQTSIFGEIQRLTILNGGRFLDGRKRCTEECGGCLCGLDADYSKPQQGRTPMLASLSAFGILLNAVELL